MPEVYISQIDFGDGIIRTIKDPNASGGSEYYVEQDVILSSSNDTTVTFTDSKITEDSVVDVYTSFGTLPFRTMSINAGSCIVTFPQQESALNVTVRIYIR